MKKYTAYEGSHYIAKIPDENGIVSYTEEENKTWQFLINRQTKVVKDRACDAYSAGLSALNFAIDRVPQCGEISEVLMRCTNWSVIPVPTLIPDDEFFNLLAHRKFPAATFIRRWDEIDYLREPDIFHEYFGHCPLLTNSACADFMQQYGEFALSANEQERRYLARLYWFTIEFGLIESPQGLRIYGGGILSSKGETVYSLESPTPLRKPFDLLDVLRTPYRIDRMQPIYFVISDFSALYQLFEMDLLAQIQVARELGDHPPAF